MLLFFFESHGELFIYFLPQGSTINSKPYCSTLMKLRKAIKSKQPDLLTQQVILLYGNSRPHISRETKTTLQNFLWKVFKHPPDSPNLSSCDIHIFGIPKRAIQETGIHSGDEVKEAAQNFFQNQLLSFYSKVIALLRKWWDLCYNTMAISLDFQ
ncbi:histone-lysine N-methyltransferase SETMAR [Nephila pilipes]|uniref:Histone-lysine N-methyltransferase SETMAR n=1 Tax=Nephila pilipes TaxID=299642 RepID=A0A8X6Q9I7_NEPPI|nr:histone-lysine N-methyltransferase SETMAR [Nephila pilipes]